MKIRNGFVSNSSSSSFCIFGTETSSPLGEAIKKKSIANHEAKGNTDELEDYAIFEDISGDGMSYRSSDWASWIGRSWASIGDDETGKQLKDGVIKSLAAAADMPLDEAAKHCSTIEESYYS